MKHIFLKDIDEFLEKISFLRTFKKFSLEPIHWKKIFTIVGRPNVINHSFSLKELIFMEMDRYKVEINAVLGYIVKESDYTDKFAAIKKFWESYEL